MDITFWGIRGSIAVSGPDFARFGGNTTCIEVAHDGETDGETDTLTTADAGEPADGGLFVDALTRDGSTSEPAADLGPEVADGGAVIDGGVACNLTDPDWAACCEAQNWNPAAGCMAWGPPVPPALA